MPRAVEDLAFYLISNISKDFSYRNIAKYSGIKNVHTVKKYLGYMENAFLFFELNRFSFKVREQISSNKKIYCFDNGFIEAKTASSSEDIGRLFENLVAIELKKRELNDEFRLYYWANERREEVDFLLKRGPKIEQLIQVCYSLDSSDTKKREIRALVNASIDTGCNNLMVLTGDYESEETVTWHNTSRNITFMPLWKWLLED
jgi:hypothetical protein